MRPRRLAVLVFTTGLVTACSPIAVSPPARTFAVTAPIEPVTGQDVQIDVARIGTVFGPDLVSGNGRIRRRLQPGLVLEADGGFLHVTNDGAGGDRNAYTGRLGLVRHIDDGLSIGVGAGGGLSPTAGAWGSIDIGGSCGGTGRSVRPILGGNIGYAMPLSDRTFTVTDEEGDRTTLQLPRNRFAQVNLGLELGPRDTALVLGASLVKFWFDEQSRVSATDPNDRTITFLALGIGVRIATR